MCQFLDTRKKTCCHKSIIQETITVPGLPTNTCAADEKPPSYPDSTNLAAGTQGSRREGGKGRLLLQTLLYSHLSLPGAPLLGSKALKLLYKDPSQAYSISPWAPSISITSFFFAQQNSHSLLAAGKQSD